MMPVNALNHLYFVPWKSLVDMVFASNWKRHQLSGVNAVDKRWLSPDGRRFDYQFRLLSTPLSTSRGICSVNRAFEWPTEHAQINPIWIEQAADLRSRNDFCPILLQKKNAWRPLNSARLVRLGHCDSVSKTTCWRHESRARCGVTHSRSNQQAGQAQRADIVIRVYNAKLNRATSLVVFFIGRNSRVYKLNRAVSFLF